MFCCSDVGCSGSRQDGERRREQQFGLLQHQNVSFGNLRRAKEEPPSLLLLLLLLPLLLLLLSRSLLLILFFRSRMEGRRGPALDTNRRENPTVLSSTSQLPVYYLMRSLVDVPPLLLLLHCKFEKNEVIQFKTWYGFRASLLPIVMTTYGM